VEGIRDDCRTVAAEVMVICGCEKTPSVVSASIHALVLTFLLIGAELVEVLGRCGEEE